MTEKDKRVFAQEVSEEELDALSGAMEFDWVLMLIPVSQTAVQPFIKIAPHVKSVISIWEAFQTVPQR